MIKLRTQTHSDQTFLFKLFTETRTKKLQLKTLPDEIASTIIKQQFHAQTTGYQTDYPDAEFLIVELGDQPIGRLVILERPETSHIIDIAISEEKQGQAIGSNLIKSIIEKSTKEQKTVTLNVDELTGPVALYERLGFKKMGITAGSINMQHSVSNRSHQEII